jgi:hypothetical protein
MRIKKIDRDDPGDLLTQKIDLNGTFIFRPLAMGRDYRIATAATVMVNNLSMKIGFRSIVSARRPRTISMSRSKLMQP